MEKTTSILFDVQEDVKLVAEAIKSVLDLEVIIYDDQKTVVAATGGGAHAQVGDKVRGFIVSEVLKTSQPVYNYHPGVHELCKPCSLWGNCPEKADVSFPLIHQGVSVGVVSITAFSQEQEMILRQKQIILSNFLGKMADLISNKISSKFLTHQYFSLSQMLEITIQSMYEGILAVDKEGRCIELNNSGSKILGLTKEMVLGKPIHKILPPLRLKSVLSTQKGFKDEECWLEVNGKNVKVIGNATPLLQGDSVVGAVYTFKDLEDVQRYAYHLTSENDDASTFACIIGNSKALHATITRAKRIAPSKATVLILGESGTGKELFARSIHAESQRKTHAFRAINCAAIPEQLLESELFGYNEGAFTGAIKKGKPGKFEMADGGTIFLDEIGDMPLHLQVKLLRVLQEQKVERVGGSDPIPIDVRIIAATNKNLEQMVQQGTFREDLYYRLDVISLSIPPLRERQEDIPILLQYFLTHYSEITGKQIRGFSEETERILTEYKWPGNVRELQNVVEYAVHMVDASWIQPNHLPERISRTNVAPSWDENAILPLEQLEAEMITKALQKYGTSVEGKKMVADALGINLATLYRNLQKLKNNM
ncbi:sigma-54-dependent Fis family transcriptional regulator [Brevibacillus sp. NRS-1366]|uniref:sigma-54-dependent Fis family transcriptional regulator n=1 Tax=Brevibacillus sp. NRS-1366 TaxID=3233899 RepID=UPI003D19A496